MATKLEVTFNGLCLFSKDGDGVKVWLPYTSHSPEHCGVGHGQHRGLHRHTPAIIVGGDGAGPAFRRTVIALGDATLDLSAGSGDLAVPDHLARVAELSPDSDPDPGPRPDRVAATIEIRGGEWVDRCYLATEPVSDGWKRFGRLRWQANWDGSIGGDALVVRQAGGPDILIPPATPGEPIRIVIANVPEKDLDVWRTKDWYGTSGLDPAAPGRDHHFYWFHWMMGWDAPPHCKRQAVPEHDPSQVGNKGARPFTCVMAEL